MHCTRHPCALKLSVKMDRTRWHLPWKVYQRQREGSSRWGRGEPPFDRRSGPKPNTDGYWSGPLQLLKLRVRVLGCDAEEKGNTLTRAARLNEIQGESFCSSAEQSPARQYSDPSVGRSLMNVGFPWPSAPTLLSFSLLPYPRPLYSTEWNWHLWMGAIRMKQCYGAPYGGFIGPQWYFIDAWNNASAQPKQAIWKPWRN